MLNQDSLYHQTGFLVTEVNDPYAIWRSARHV